MRSRNISSASIGLTLLLGTPTLSLADWAGKRYSVAEIATIMKMRERGEGLADVAKVVVAAARTVKDAELAERARQKALRASKEVEARSIIASR